MLARLFRFFGIEVSKAKREEKKINKSKDDLNFVLKSLFPPLQIHENDGTRFYVDFSIDANLQSILNDLQEGISDKMTQDAISECIIRLTDIRKKFNVYSEFKDASATSYIVASNLEKSKE